MPVGPQAALRTPGSNCPALKTGTYYPVREDNVRLETSIFMAFSSAEIVPRIWQEGEYDPGEPSQACDSDPPILQSTIATVRMLTPDSAASGS
jgi:hypothetical protein